MDRRVAIIGFGEAGRTLAPNAAGISVHAYDRITDDTAMHKAAMDAGVTLVASATMALAGAEAVLCLVTADQAVPAAENYSRDLPAGALWLDMNSVAPDTKRTAAAAIEASGGRYVDVAIMAPVDAARLDVPLLASGPHAGAAIALLSALGFTRLRHVAGGIGAASAIKMIRSVMVKGLEALTAECLMAADAAGVIDEVLASFEASERPQAWVEHADYNLDRMLLHGLRRAAEMEEVVKTLDRLGTGNAMSRGTAQRQRAIGSLGVAPPEGLKAKLATLNSKQEKAA
jgi:3-hydroxyisobutyrate dehydrogenase-like beta-hydroxyacid dehydrogenase